MAAKVIIVFCAQAVLAQVAYSACISNAVASPCSLAGGYGLRGANCLGGANGLGSANGLGGYSTGVASTGGSFPISSASYNAPIGIAILSQNCYQGTLNVGGKMPFLGTVGLEGVLPTAGAGAVSYGCGNGAVGIGVGAEGPIATGIANGNDYAPAASLATAGPGYAGYGAGLAGYGAGRAGYGAGVGGYGSGVAGYGRGCGCRTV